MMMAAVIVVGPFLEVIGELCVRNNVSLINVQDRREIIQNVFEHRLAGHVEQRFGLSQSQRIKSRRVSCRKNNKLHIWSAPARRRFFERAFRSTRFSTAA